MLVLDLSSKAGVEKMIDDAQSSHGRIDIICNNVGIMEGMMPVGDTSDELWQHVLNINLKAPFWACRGAIPLILKNGHGVILNTASIASLFGGRAGVSYTVSKHGLIGLTKSIAVYYGSKGIRCNAMVLGAVKTAIGLGSASPSPLGLEVMKRSGATMTQIADPEEIAKRALFLATDDSSYINGSCIVIDNGWSVYLPFVYFDNH